MKSLSVYLFVFLALVPALTACPPVDPDPGPGLGVDPATVAQSDQALAGVIREGASGERGLFGGIAAEGAAGDVKIYNSKVQFLIQGAYRSHSYVDTGGGIIDVDLVRDGAILGRDGFDDIFTSIGGSRLFHAETVEIVADGSKGGSAIVRAIGKDVPWDFINGALEASSPLLSEQFLQIETLYELAPDSYNLKITSTVTRRGPLSGPVNLLDGLMGSDEDQFPWTAGRGLQGAGSSAAPAIGKVGRYGEGAVTLWRPDGNYNDNGIGSLVSTWGIIVIAHPTVDLAQGESTTLVRYLTVAPDTVTAEAERGRIQGLTNIGRVRGTVQDDDGTAVGGAWVHFIADDLSSGGHAVTDKDGIYQASLPVGNWTAYLVADLSIEHMDLPKNAGRYGPFAATSINDAQLDALQGTGATDALLGAYGRASPLPQQVTIESGNEATIDFTTEKPGTLSFNIIDGDGNPIPGALEIRADADPFANVPGILHDSLGLPGAGVLVRWAWTHDGSMEIDVPPGEYAVIAGHSWRHDRAILPSLQVTSGAVTPVEIVLDELINRGGRLAMDSHLHAAPSPDGHLAMEDRIIACAATGVDLPVNTDHDRAADYRPLVEALGLVDRMQWISGIEISPVTRGHFNMFPLDPKPLELINGGAEPWWIPPASTDELYQRAHERFPQALLQVNHGRSPGLMSAAGYQPPDGSIGRSSYWSWNFDMFELVNGTGRSEYQEVRADWFSWLNQGQLRIPTGVSDSHSRRSPCGFAHTDILLDAVHANDVSQDEIVAALRAGHVIVAGGVTLHTTLNGGTGAMLPGDTLIGTSAELAVRIEAPTWMQPEVLRIYRNGTVIIEQALQRPAPGNVVWLDTTWTVDATIDSWFTVEVDSTRAMGSVWGGGAPYAMSNAFLLDVDGNGWTAPGLP